MDLVFDSEKVKVPELDQTFKELCFGLYEESFK